MPIYSDRELNLAAARVLLLSRGRVLLTVLAGAGVGSTIGYWTGSVISLALKVRQPGPGFGLDPDFYKLLMPLLIGLLGGMVAYVWASYREAIIRMQVQTSLCIAEIENHARAARAETERKANVN
jgi:hypothetical protein